MRCQRNSPLLVFLPKRPNDLDSVYGMPNDLWGGWNVLGSLCAAASRLHQRGGNAIELPPIEWITCKLRRGLPQRVRT